MDRKRLSRYLRGIKQETKAILNDAGGLDQWTRDNHMRHIVDNWLGVLRK